MKLGIDLGNVYTKIATYDEGKKGPVVAELDMPSIYTPTVVGKYNKRVVWGNEALSRRLDSFYRFFPSGLGSAEDICDGYCLTDSPKMSAEECTELFLNNVIDRVRKRYMVDNISNMIIAMPFMLFRADKPNSTDVLRWIGNHLSNIPDIKAEIIGDDTAIGAYVAYNYQLLYDHYYNGTVLWLDFGGTSITGCIIEIHPIEENNGTEIVSITTHCIWGKGYSGKNDDSYASEFYIRSLLKRAIVNKLNIDEENLTIDAAFICAENDLRLELISKREIIRDYLFLYGCEDLESLEETCFKIEYKGEEVTFTYSFLVESYNELLRKVVDSFLNDAKIGLDYRNIDYADQTGSYKILCTGGFAQFPLLYDQFCHSFGIINFDNRIMEIAPSLSNLDSCISYGAALIAQDVMKLALPVNFSVGVKTSKSIEYAIQYGDSIEYDKIYYFSNNGRKRYFVWGDVFFSDICFQLSNEETAVFQLKSTVRERIETAVKDFLQGNEFQTISVGFSISTSNVFSIHFNKYDVRHRKFEDNTFSMEIGRGVEFIDFSDVSQKLNKGENLFNSIQQGSSYDVFQYLQALKTENSDLFSSILKECPVLAEVSCESDIDKFRLILSAWLLTTTLASTWRREYLYGTHEENIIRDENETQETAEEQTEVNAVVKEKDFPDSQMKGEFLEQSLLKLLKVLFHFIDSENQEKRILEYLHQRKKGPQNGRDIDLEYLDAEGRKRICLFECKYYEKDILREKDIIPKLFQTYADLNTQTEIDHWILFAPLSTVDEEVKKTIEKIYSEPWPHFGIKDVQIWTKESQIEELIGLVPDLYDKFYKCENEEEHPRNWTLKHKEEIRNRWLEKLRPTIDLPKGLRKYLMNYNLILPPTRYEAKYDELYKRRIRIGYRDEKKVLSKECLEENMKKWLRQPNERIRVILAEFGNGKTFFIYSLCRMLIDRFKENPQERYLPIYFSLQELGETYKFDSLIENRMRQLECNAAQFQEISEKYHLLVCLDGFDEMSTSVTGKAINRNAKALARFLQYLSTYNNTKIVITSRNQCFLENNVPEFLTQAVKSSIELLYLAEVPKRERRSYILSNLEESSFDIQKIQTNLENISDILGKPFFLDMVRLLVENDTFEITDEVSIYRHLINSCLERKQLDSFEIDSDDIILPEMQRERIFEALLKLAIGLQRDGKDSMTKSEMRMKYGVDTVDALWLMDDYSAELIEDADNRFSMRTLLRYEDKNTISFAHRSIREFFVAVYLLKLLDQDIVEFQTILDSVGFSLEILRFFGKLLVDDPFAYAERSKKLSELLDESEDDQENGMSFAGKLFQTLYYAEQKLDRLNWTYKDLSNVVIPGANLSGIQFTGSKFINANLNNVIFDDCDLRDCNMKGAKLEETGRIDSITVLDTGILSHYVDGTFRKWNIMKREEEVCELKEHIPGECYYLGSGYVLAVTEDHLTIHDIYSGTKMIDAEKPLSVKIIEMQEDQIIIQNMEEFLSISTVQLERFKIRKTSSLYSAVSIQILDKETILWSDGDKLYQKIIDDDTELAVNENNGSISTIAARKTDQRLICAVSYIGGNIEVWDLSKVPAEMYEHVLIKEYVIQSMLFCDDEHLAIVDTKGGIHILEFDCTRKKFVEKADSVMKLEVHCKNAKIGGLKPENVRALLSKSV